MHLALFFRAAPRQEWPIQGEHVSIIGAAAVITALCALALVRLLRSKVAKDDPYPKWLVLLACGIGMIILGAIMYRLNPPGPFYLN